jgi:glycoprotein 2-beta-D-xylosyltransferase
VDYRIGPVGAVGNMDPWSFEVEEFHCTSFDHSIKRPRHGCDANKDTMNVFCNFNQLRIDNSKINMDQGGEALLTVMGREESVEFPKYQRGAFALSTKPDYRVPMTLRSNMKYLENVLNAIRYPTGKNNGKIDLSCDVTYPGITLFTTRYEYVNLYHTFTDWWSAFFVLPQDYWEQPHRVVFLDGHAEGGLDKVWKVLFGDFHFVKHLPKGKGLCFEKAIFIPPGYKTPLFPDIVRQRCPNRTMAANFSDFVLGRYNLKSVQPIRGNIVIIDRQPYVSHPRSDASKFRRKSNNFAKLQSTLQMISGVTVQLVRLESHSFGEQLKLVREAHVLIGNHGAALTHLMFMDQTRSHVIEFSVDYNDIFLYLSEWRGIDFETIHLYGNDVGGEEISNAFDLVRGFMAMPVTKII